MHPRIAYALALILLPSLTQAEPNPCDLRLNPGQMAQLEPLVQAVHTSPTLGVNPAERLIETLKGVQKRGYDAASRLINESLFAELKQISKQGTSEAQQLQNIEYVLTNWKEQIRSKVITLNRRRTPFVTDGFSATDRPESARAENQSDYDGAVSFDATADSARNDLIMASSEISSYWEDLVIEYAAVFHQGKAGLQTYLTVSNVDVPIVLLSTPAGEPLDAKLSLNGKRGKLRSSDLEFVEKKNASVWFQEDTPDARTDPVLLRLARIVETPDHFWIWVFLPIRLD